MAVHLADRGHAAARSAWTIAGRAGRRIGHGASLRTVDIVNANTAAAGPARAACHSPRRPAGADSRRNGSVEQAGNTRASGRLRPWTMRRLPAALNPNVSAGIRADEHAASPSRMRGIQWRSSACTRHAAKRRCVAHARDAFAYRCGGSTGWLDCGAGRLPVSRLTARTGAARASTKTRASVGGGAGSVKAERAAGPGSGWLPRVAGSRARRFARGRRCAIVAPRSVPACAFRTCS